MPLTAAEKTLASMNALYGPARQAVQGPIHRLRFRQEKSAASNNDRLVRCAPWLRELTPRRAERSAQNFFSRLFIWSYSPEARDSAGVPVADLPGGAGAGCGKSVGYSNAYS